MAGGDVLLANELSTSTARTYSTNHPKTQMINTNIKTLVQDGVDLEDVDILDGSPPCVTFSVARATKREHEEESKNNIYYYLEKKKPFQGYLYLEDSYYEEHNANLY